MTTANLTFNAINEALVRINARMDAAECHGTLCGLLCAADRLDYAAWLDRAFPTVDPADALAKEVDQTLKPLYNLALKQISGSSYDLALVLPDDETPLLGRTQALGDWCQGFLMGLAMAGIRDFTRLPPDSAEFIQDLLDISRIEEQELEEGEDEEQAFAGIVEYVRAGVLLIRSELRPAAMSPQGSPSLH
ncbi:MAG: hypothetical protein A2V90_00575 [Gammaproteobacteria bacterium RBG_16_57_12]|nr:MAG: hypothetical protein A2V90_00575 [Gammaproteobacteria bacterium RBG_16_57_12]